jgi:hypothetical protein
MTYGKRTNKTTLPETEPVRLAQASGLVGERGQQSGHGLRLLKVNKGQWVSLPELGSATRTRATGTVVSRLRQMGCVIENETKLGAHQGPGYEREVYSAYRMLKEPAEIAEELYNNDGSPKRA